MIKFKYLKWSNVFSYGANNSISFTANPLTQLLGKNGNGKSSIALILEEGLFNTNSKNIKKGAILNRYVKDKKYSIEVCFEKDGLEYIVTTSRGATTGTVVLKADGIDISGHTATSTYKNIEQILGFNHKTFSQIVYQSSAASLEFLTATDTARKKFLIDLWDLTKYTDAAEHFKVLSSTYSKDIDSAQSKLTVINSWIDANTKVDLTPMEYMEVPSQPTELNTELTIITNTLSSILTTNKKITQNNTYKSILDSLSIPDKPSTSMDISNERELLMKKTEELGGLRAKLQQGESLAKKCKGPTIKCPTCSQDMDNSTMFSTLQQFEANRPDIVASISAIEADISKYRNTIAQAEAINKELQVYNKALAEWEKYHSLYDSSIDSTLLDKDALELKLAVIKQDIATAMSAIARAESHNKKAEAHNARIALIEGQLETMRKDRDALLATVNDKMKYLANIQVLLKTFSTTGLVAYKIECLVKDLEDASNHYLTDLADGRFQLSFKIAQADKLNVVITDNGSDIDITALSTGERARVNVAALLGIRKLMQSLSNSRTNLLILDETIENLDSDGKEKLIELLLEEESLNTFLISHGFSHPLLEKLSIVKENNISRIE